MATKFGLSIAEFDKIIGSEAGLDYGTSAQSEELWLAATARQWDFNGLGVLAELGQSNTYYPYILCYSDPQLSGYGRILALNELLSNAGVQVDQDVFIGDTIVNVKEARTCVWTSSQTAPYLDTIDAAPANLTQYLEVQPHMFSMKIVDGTSERVAKQLSEYAEGRLEERLEERLGLAVTMCPVYREAIRMGMATYGDLVDDYVEFLTQEGGMAVYNSSFYVEAADDPVAYPSLPAGIQMWSDVIKNVVGRTDPVTGANRCLDVVIPEDLVIRRDFEDLITVKIEEYDDEMSTAEFEDCMWYVIAGLALHPYVCQIEDLATPVVGFPVPAPDSTGTTNGQPSTTSPGTISMGASEDPASMPTPSYAHKRLSSVPIAFVVALASCMAWLSYDVL